jgi:hypothetical protein
VRSAALLLDTAPLASLLSAARRPLIRGLHTGLRLGLGFRASGKNAVNTWVYNTMTALQVCIGVSIEG